MKQQLGFDSVVEVAIGADLCTIEEAKDFMRAVPEEQPFMAISSCCPSWSVMAKAVPDARAAYSDGADAAMVLTAFAEEGAQGLQDRLCRPVPR